MESVRLKINSDFFLKNIEEDDEMIELQVDPKMELIIDVNDLAFGLS
jgi:hypothetical protein